MAEYSFKIRVSFGYLNICVADACFNESNKGPTLFYLGNRVIILKTDLIVDMSQCFHIFSLSIFYLN